MLRQYMPQFIEIVQQTANDARAKGIWDQCLKTSLTVTLIIGCLGLLVYLHRRGY